MPLNRLVNLCIIYVSLKACLQGERLPLYYGYPSKRVKISSGVQANFTGRVTLSPGSTLPALLTCFVMLIIKETYLSFYKSDGRGEGGGGSAHSQ